MNTGNSNTNSNTAVAVAVTDKLHDKVVIIIANMTGSGEIFTAFDVTKLARSENPIMNVPHEDVKEMVRNLFRSDFCDEYDCRCIELTVSAMAYVYYPKGESPYDHKLAALPNTDPTAPTDADGNTDLTGEKRLNIPASLLDKLALVPGKLVKVETIGGIMSLTATTDPSGSALVVNSDGRLRLNSRMLTKAFGTLPAKYDISYNNDDFSIEVKSADITDTDTNTDTD